ncbi:hypothetical protein MMC13_002510 [Lambiella insularis]|nr:hypothetical protein [Lambiella insularis]
MPQRVPSYCPRCDTYVPDDPSVDHHRDWTTHSSDMAGCPKVVVKYCSHCIDAAEAIRTSMKEGISLYGFLNTGAEGNDVYRQRVKAKIEKHRAKLGLVARTEEGVGGKSDKKHWWNRFTN